MILSLAQPKTLVLYHYDTCPFCAKTRQAIAELDLKIERRDIQTNHQHRADLYQ
jgi:glutaredoxin